MPAHIAPRPDDPRDRLPPVDLGDVLVFLADEAKGASAAAEGARAGPARAAQRRREACLRFLLATLAPPRARRPERFFR
jgi:hypothetical protein